MKTSTKSLTYSGIMLVLAVILLFFASFAPGVEMTLFALASFFTGFVILETGLRGGAVFYIAQLILTFLIIPNKVAILPFLFFFGLYGILKYLIENLRKIPIEICLKLIYFNVGIILGSCFLKEILFSNITLPEFPWYILLAIANAFFLFYDYLYTLAILFYKSKIQRYGSFK